MSQTTFRTIFILNGSKKTSNIFDWLNTNYIFHASEQLLSVLFLVFLCISEHY